MENIIKELGKRHKTLPNIEFGGNLKELDEYKFINAVLIPIKDPLWEQAVKNIAAELYDGDLFVFHDPEVVFQTLRDAFINEINELAFYYTHIINDKFKYEIIEDEDYFVNNYEKISVDSICIMVSNCFVNHLESVESNIKNQLKLLAQNKKWAEELYLEKNKTEMDINVQEIILRIRKLF